jgi:hypothetical protein
MSSNLLIQNIAELFTMSSTMNGGRSNNIGYTSKQNNVLVILSMTLFFILIKGLIVYLLYNFMVPKIMYSLSDGKSLETIESNFKTLSFSESVLLVILANTLFYF